MILALILFAAAAVFAVAQDSVRINEVSDRGTTSGPCPFSDWTELHLPASASSPVDLAGYLLHDDHGPSYDKAYTFPAGYVLEPGQYAVVCHRGEDPNTGPQFGVGVTDTITLLNGVSGEVVSTVGPLGGRGVRDVTTAYDESTGAYEYTTTPTPGEPNEFAEYVPETVEEMRARLVAQNDEGTEFFNMDDGGMEVEDGMPYLLDLRIEMDPDERQKMREERSYEVYSDFLSATVTSAADPDDVLLSLPGGGRMRPKGQSTLILGTCLDRSVPYVLDFDRGSNPDQSLFGAKRVYLRTHFGDGSFGREWTMHRMLARFGLPHLRTRSVRVFINGVLEGLYTLMEAPDQEYVYLRSFPNFDRNAYGLYKVKTMSIGCGRYKEGGLLGQGIDLEAMAMKRINETATPPYGFERGDHRPLLPIKPDNILGCAEAMSATIVQDYSDVALAYYRKGTTCGEFLVEDGLVDRDLGPESMDEIMMEYVDKHLGPKRCDADCSNSDLASDVDTSQVLRNMAVMASMLHIDSPLNNGNNYYLAYNDGLWSMVQYDHNNMMDGSVLGLLCSQECEKDFIKWSILRPTCRSLEENQVVGPMLSDEGLRTEYLGYVREFVETVMMDGALHAQMRDHLVAIEQAARADSWNDAVFFFEAELGDSDEWQVEIPQGGIARSYTPFLPAVRARAAEIVKQLEALDTGKWPREADDIGEAEACVAWDAEGPREGGQGAGCPDQCAYEGCYREGWELPAFCDPNSDSCIHGKVDMKCEGVANTMGYEGMAPFEGSNQMPFCWTDPTLGPLKIAPCPAKVGGEAGSPAGCLDNCRYEGCYREEFEVQGYCAPETNSCVHGKIDAKCEGVANTMGYSGMTPFEGSDQMPFCWTDPTLGPLKMAQCPAKDESNGVSAGCPDNCFYEGCYREGFAIPAFCDPDTNKCIHAVVDSQCEGVPDTQGYDGITNFEGSDQVPFCWTDSMLGAIKVAFCPAKGAPTGSGDVETTTGTTVAATTAAPLKTETTTTTAPMKTETTAAPKDEGNDGNADVDSLDSGSARVFVAGAIVQLSVLSALALSGF